MDYKETETSRMLKQCNDLLYKTIHKFFTAKSANVRNSFQWSLISINKAIKEYTLKRQKEIEAERAEPVTLPNGRVITKGTFIDTQQKYELDDEETTNYIMMRWYDNCVNIFLKKEI